MDIREVFSLENAKHLWRKQEIETKEHEKKRKHKIKTLSKSLKEDISQDLTKMYDLTNDFDKFHFFFIESLTQIKFWFEKVEDLLDKDDLKYFQKRIEILNTIYERKIEEKKIDIVISIIADISNRVDMLIKEG